MEHIFGVVECNGVTVENLKTVGQTHTNLGGFTQTVREYTGSTITDRFRVVEKYRSEEDAEGNCYDWYVISDHYRYVDKTEAVKTQLGAELLDSYELQADHEYRLCMLELGLE
jgi:hypothetical protein